MMTLNEFLRQFAEALDEEAKGSWYADYYEDEMGAAKRLAKQDTLSSIASIVRGFIQDDE